MAAVRMEINYNISSKLEGYMFDLPSLVITPILTPTAAQPSWLRLGPSSP
jgi:hypothetical protein